MSIAIYTALIILIIIALYLCRNTVVPKLIKLGGFITAVAALILPVYTISVMGESTNVNILDFIIGININGGLGYSETIKSNYFYIVLFVIPIIGIVATVVKDNKITNMLTAFLSFLGLFAGCMLLFKQVEIGSIIKISANIGIVIMFIAYGVSIGISIMGIYSNIDKEIKQEENMDTSDKNENTDVNNKINEKAICPKCGQENPLNFRYCKKCGEKM